MRGESVENPFERTPAVGVCRKGFPPYSVPGGLCGRVGRLDQAHRIAGRGAQAAGCQCERSEQRLVGLACGVAQYECALRDRTGRAPDFRLRGDPVGQLAGEPARLEPVAGGAVCRSAE